MGIKYFFQQLLLSTKLEKTKVGKASESFVKNKELSFRLYQTICACLSRKAS